VNGNGFLRILISAAVVLALTGSPTLSQRPLAPLNQPEQVDIRLPNGKFQSDEILKEDHQKSLRDVAEILKIAAQLQTDLQKEDYRVLSISSMKKAGQIEKLAKNIRTRIGRY
jgi:hypothetical protein